MLIVDMYESDGVEQSHISTKMVDPIYQVCFYVHLAGPALHFVRISLLKSSNAKDRMLPVKQLARLLSL